MAAGDWRPTESMAVNVDLLTLEQPPVPVELANDLTAVRTAFDAFEAKRALYDPDAPPPSGNPLADTAAAMLPGDFVRFEYGDMPESILDSCSSRTIVEYCVRGHWYGGKVYFFGTGHLCTGSDVKLVEWDEATGDWSLLNSPANSSHGFDRLAVSPVDGTVAVLVGQTVHVSDDGGHNWDTLPPVPSSQWSGKHGIEYDANGELHVWDSYWGLGYWDGNPPLMNAWIKVFSSFTSKPNGQIVYMPAHGEIWCGGGNGASSAWGTTVIAFDGSTTTTFATPMQYGTSANHPASLHPNPVTGEGMLIESDGGIWRYINGNWTEVGQQQIWGGNPGFAVSIPVYGVMFVIRDNGDCYLYKPE